MVYWYYSIFGNISILVNVSRQQSILSPGIFQHLSDFMLGVKALPEILPLKSPISSPARE
jgi:hypothetical protein